MNGGLLILIILSILILWYVFSVCYRYKWRKPKCLKTKYGDGWVVITGASSGQGKQFATEFAKRSFNLILIGSPRTQSVADMLIKHYDIQVIVIVKDFNKAFEQTFFNDIEQTFSDKKISILINNIGHRTGWVPSHEQPSHEINDTIACGTVVQSRLTHLLIPKLIDSKGAIVFITAQCIGPSLFGSGELTIPYLNVYEASNAFGYYHANSIYQEYKDKIDILNITPGAVITDNTSYLDGTISAIKQDKFVKNIMNMIGTTKGATCGYWKHEVAVNTLGYIPFFKKSILKKTGKKIAHNMMKNKVH